jgi:hypothetical protein
MSRGGAGQGEFGNVMRREAKPTGRSALCTLARVLSATGIASSLAGCVVPGTSTFALKPATVPPPFEDASQLGPLNAADQTTRPAQDGAGDAPRRELAFPETSELKPPQAEP